MRAFRAVTAQPRARARREPAPGVGHSATSHRITTSDTTACSIHSQPSTQKQRRSRRSIKAQRRSWVIRLLRDGIAHPAQVGKHVSVPRPRGLNLRTGSRRPDRPRARSRARSRPTPAPAWPACPRGGSAAAAPGRLQDARRHRGGCATGGPGAGSRSGGLAAAFGAPSRGCRSEATRRQTVIVSSGRVGCGRSPSRSSATCRPPKNPEK
jgi:hypothetical protein